MLHNPSRTRGVEASPKAGVSDFQAKATRFHAEWATKPAGSVHPIVILLFNGCDKTMFTKGGEEGKNLTSTRGQTKRTVIRKKLKSYH